MSPNDPAEYLQAPNRVRYIVDRTTELTPLKAVAAKAIQLAEDERAAAMDLATVISSDQALTAKLLRLSNSAYYGYARRISTVREAVILLGMRTVRSVAIASGIIDAFAVTEQDHCFDCDLFWAHSVTVGLVAEAIARETKSARPEDAFTAGVIHDIGKLAMLLTEPELFARTVALVTVDEITYSEAESQVFGVSHAQIGARLAQRWKFPESLVEAIQAHHPAKPVTRIDSLAAVVAMANLACNREGLACGFDWVGDECRRPTEVLAPQVDVALSRVHGGMRTLEEKSQAFLRHVTAHAPRWYALPGMLAADEPPPAECA
jgi:putative nucleotidyltransferase with HDIG domain